MYKNKDYGFILTVQSEAINRINMFRCPVLLGFVFHPAVHPQRFQIMSESNESQHFVKNFKLRCGEMAEKIWTSE